MTTSAPQVEVEYEHLLRGPGHRWWQPLLSLLVLVVVMIAGLVWLVVVAFDAAFLMRPFGPMDLMRDWFGTAQIGVAMTLFTDASLAWGIVAALLAVFLGFQVNPGVLHSVAGRVRWRWLGRCVAVLLPVWLLYIGGMWAATGALTSPRQDGWEWLVVLALVATPFQAAGEEYVFRGWLLQVVGSWFRNRWVAIGVPTVLSAGLFAAAHGSTDPWIFLDLAAMAVAAVVLTVRTGGLEAAVALHLVNNVTVTIFGALTGGLADSYIDDTTTSDPVSALVSLAGTVIGAALLLWQARRAGVRRTGLPAGARGPVTPSLAPAGAAPEIRP